MNNFSEIGAGLQNVCLREIYFNKPSKLRLFWSGIHVSTIYIFGVNLKCGKS